MENRACRRGRYWVTAFAVVTAAALTAGCSLLPKEQGALKPPLVKPAEAVVRTVDARIGTIERRISGSARFVPTEVSYHAFDGSGGKVLSVEALAGDVVKEGDPLVVLDLGDMDVQLLSRELEYEKKKLALRTALAGGDDGQIRIAELELKLAGLLFDKTKRQAEGAVLRAKTDGVVTFVADLMPGDPAEAGTALVAVAKPSGLRLALDAEGNPVMKDVDVGMEANIMFDGAAYRGTVVQTPSSAPFAEDARLAEEYGKTLYIEMAELPVTVGIGDSADVEIVTARRENVLVLPKRGVRTYFDRTYVQLLDGESRREADVETGLENATEIEIVKGLEAGAKVILP